MSGFEKAQQAGFLDYHTSTGLPDPSAYPVFTQPPYQTNVFDPSALTGHPPSSDQARDGAPISYLTGLSANGSGFPAPTGCHELGTPVFDPRDRFVFEITSYAPREGVQGGRVNVYIRTTHDLVAAPPSSVYLLFASKKAEASIQPLDASGTNVKQYAISAEVPSFISTGWHSFNVPLRLLMDGLNAGQGPPAVEVGAFTYQGQAVPPSFSESSRKRKASVSSDEDGQRPTKRSVETQLRIQDHSSTAFNYGQPVASPYSPFLPTPTSANVHPPRYQQTGSPRSMGHHYSTSATSQTSMTAPSPHTPSWSPSFASVNHPNLNTRAPTTPMARPTKSVTPEKQSNPTLIRTSTIQQSPGSTVASGMGSINGHTFNPYGLYPHKAILKLNGDLDQMAENWSLEEWEMQRRLVLFTRQQHGSTIHADFKPIAPEDRPQNSICISCIWWEAKKECFVTSVDTIFLLESLVAVRFTVEEKNRIRRNLEGFRPLTVSKAKQDSEDFFKVIMGFPNPKPRNIEKDVKVFPWKILAHALKKIIGKYSASYSSTAGALLTPATSTYPSTGASDASTESHTVPSPGLSQAASSVSMYPSSLSSNPYSPRISTQARPMPTVTGPPDLRLHVPNGQPGYSYPATYSYQHQTMSGTPQAHYDHPMTAPVSRGNASWDYPSYVEASPQTANPTGMPSMDYGRIHTSLPASQGFMTPTSYSMISHTTGA